MQRTASGIFSCLVLLLAPVACSSDVPKVTGEPVPRPSATPTTFVNGGECPPAPAGFADDLQGDAGCVTYAGELAVYALVDDEGKPKSWHTLIAGESQALEAGNPFSYPRAIAQVDVDVDGDEEWLIKTFDLASHGTNWQQLGLFLLRGTRLIQVTSAGGPLPIRVGGISRMGEGARCEPGSLVLLRTVSENRQNTRWSFSEATYQIHGTSARKGEVTRGLLRLRGYNDPKLDPYYEIRCHGYTYP